MTVYHYELQIDLTTLEWEQEMIEMNFGSSEATTLSLNTTVRLVKDEILTITSFTQALINLKITRINRYGFEDTTENELIEKDMSSPWYQENRPNSTSDEAWFTCKANAFTLDNNL